MNAARAVLLVHNTFTSRSDVEFACQQAARLGQSFFYVLCPGANLYIEKRLPDITMLLETGVPIALGTDSLASNHQLSIAKEMGYLLNAYPQLGQEQLLSWATYNGARALGFEDKLGGFTKGKKPGVILLTEGLDTVHRIA
jgi:cytosine/adenosine deaminase-related metal-dependent hydrolase